MPQWFLKIRPGRIFDPIRDSSFINAQVYPEALRWVLIAAESVLTFVKQQPPSSALIRRRVIGYRNLNALLSNEETRSTNHAIVGILSAITVDAVFATEDTTRQHIQGLDGLVRQRGGLQAVFAGAPDAALRPMYFVSLFHLCPRLVANFDELRSIAISTKDRLCLMQEWYYTMNECGEPTERHVRKLAETRTYILNSEALQQHLRQTYNNESPYVANSSLFYILYSFSQTLWALSAKCGIAAAEAFLWRISYVIRDSCLPDPITGEPQLLLTTLMYMVSEIRTESFQLHYGKRAQLLESEMCSAEIDAVKLFSHLENIQRSQLIATLKQWLAITSEDQCHTLNRTTRKLPNVSALLDPPISS